jgi:oxygen-independent coproporphyrinogen-3 oxidase
MDFSIAPEHAAIAETVRRFVERELIPLERDVIRREAIERVMCDLALDLDTLPAAVLATALPGLQALERDGLVRLAGAWLTVPDEARAFLRHVAACFDAKLGTGAGRHSAAV